MREVLMVMAVVVLAVVAGGCANIGNGRVDFPGTDGIAIETIAGAMDAGKAGSGDFLRGGEAKLQAALGKTPPGPFGSLPYTTERQVVLKDGTVIPEDKIAKILEILTPTVPDAIVREVSPENYVTVPVPTPVVE